MKKSMVLFGCMVMLSIVVVVSGWNFVCEGKDAVEITKHTVMGDEAAAEGVEITFVTRCEYHQFWETSYRIGATPETDTKYTFSRKRILPENELTEKLFVESFMKMGVSGDEVFLPRLDGQIMPVEAIQAVADRTQPGDTRNEAVTLRDAYSTYPLHVSMQNAFLEVKDGAEGDFGDYFQIPVPDNHKVLVSVSKNQKGIYNISVNTINKNYNTCMEGYIKDMGAYIFFLDWNVDGVQVDNRELTHGYGIYYMPLIKKENGAYGYDIQDLTQLCDRPDDVEFLGMEEDKDGQRFLFVGKALGQLVLLPFDWKNGQWKERIYLMDCPGTDVGWSLVCEENLLLFTREDGAFSLLEREGEDYGIKMQGSLAGIKYVDLDIFNHVMEMPHLSCMAYDGRRLVLLRKRDYYSNLSYLVVLTGGEVSYVGSYEHSADIDNLWHYDGGIGIWMNEMRLKIR